MMTSTYLTSTSGKPYAAREFDSPGEAEQYAATHDQCVKHIFGGDSQQIVEIKCSETQKTTWLLYENLDA